MGATIDLREKVLEYISSADDRLLRMIYALAKSYQIEDNLEKTTVPESIYQEIDEEREKHLNGENESYSWEEVKQRLENRYDL